MAVLYTPHFVQFIGNDGEPLAGGKLYTYAAGTTTPKATYTTAAGDIENTNPIILDAYGRAVLFITGSYKFSLYDSLNNLIKTTDNVTSFNASTATNEGFFQSFSGDGSTTVFTLSDNLGTDENALMIFSENEYSTNGNFATDSGWTKGAGWTISAGVATATGAISTALEQSAGLTLVQGKEYVITYSVVRSAGSITPSIGGTAGTARSASGTYSEVIIAGSTQTISFGTSGFTGTLDNVSVRDTAGISIRNPNTYTVDGTSLTFAKAPASGTNNIYVFAPYTLIGAAGAAQVAADEAIAAQAAAQAAQVATESAVDAVALEYRFDSSTTMDDPGAGDFRLNNATLASVTAIAIDATSAATGSPDVSDFIATWGASSSTVKGQIKITKSATPATFAIYNVTAAVTDNTGWLEITVAYVTGGGTFTDTDTCYIQFVRTGDIGATGAQGPSGTVSGATSASVAASDKALFLDVSNSEALSTDTFTNLFALLLAASNSFTGGNTFSGNNSFSGAFRLREGSELTISSGAVTATAPFHTIDTEGDAASDDLDTINGLDDGETLIISAANDARTVVVKHNTGNIFNPAGVDISLDDDEKQIILRYRSALSKAVVIAQPVNTVPNASTTTPGIVEKATAAEVKAQTADKYPDSADLKNHDGIVKAHGRIEAADGSPSLVAGYNIGTIDDDGVGNYGVNLSITMSTANNTAVATVYGSTNNRTVYVDSMSTTAIEISGAQSIVNTAVDIDFSLIVLGVLA